MGNGIPARRPVDLSGDPSQGLSQLSLLPEKAVSNCRFVLKKMWLHVSDLLLLNNRPTNHCVILLRTVTLQFSTPQLSNPRFAMYRLVD